MMARNVTIWGFNMAIYVVMAIWFELMPGWDTLMFIPGFILFLINVVWISLAVGVMSTRYRDVPQVIANIIQVVFFLTPIFWSPEALPSRPAFVVLNPFYHLIEIVRAPLLGLAVPAMSGPLHRHGAGRARLHRLALSPGPCPYRILGVKPMAHISIENLTVEFAIFGADARSLRRQFGRRRPAAASCLVRAMSSP